MQASGSQRKGIFREQIKGPPIPDHTATTARNFVDSNRHSTTTPGQTMDKTRP